jgi:beta-N-acetylhexosaminidase
MQALGGEIGQRAAAALAAGCDVALHCNGKMAEMQAVAAACRPLSEAGQNRWRRAQSWRHTAEMPSYNELLAKLEALLVAR